ncbi:MAG TPA: iron ABC transporter substrate-binding protein, partial [Roseiflexaceae bacterium]|nr:iron ABC transporter substrate-binding protein [Roseiflexaceae bacterium]
AEPTAAPAVPAEPTAAPAVPAEPTAAPATPGELVVYSGRGESLVGPLIEQFSNDTGIKVSVRYGDTAEMAALILEEGNNSPADVYYGQDAGALGALAAADRLTPLPAETLNLVETRFRSPEGLWIGTSGRARVAVYNTTNLTEADLPASIDGFTDPKWKGRIGWAPTNGSFQAFITAYRVVKGEEAARAWLDGMQANEPKVYENNTSIVQAAADGEIDVGLVNHYYLYRFLTEQGTEFAARNYYLRDGDVGALVNIAGVGILNTSKNRSTAEIFVNYLLSPKAQQYFSDNTYEYPLIPGIQVNPILTPLDQIATPQIDLSTLEDLEGTLMLLQDTGVLK